MRPNNSYELYFKDLELIPHFTRIISEIYEANSFKLHIDKLLEDVTDEREQKKLIKKHHEQLQSHTGIKETTNSLKRKYYWPKLAYDVNYYINDCTTPQQNKYESKPVKQKFELTETPGKPFEIIHMDTFSFDKQQFITIIDKISKYGQAYSIQNKTGIRIFNAILTFTSHHDNPKKITRDSEGEFKNHEMKD